MDTHVRSLWEAMRRDPNDESAKLEYEEYLAENDPLSPELELLVREREIANAYRDQEQVDRLGDELIEFKVRTDDYFWDCLRGRVDALHRSFKVWLMSFNETHRFAIEQAARYTLHTTIDLDHIPMVIKTTQSAMSARRIKFAFTDFVRRYRGPSGNEPEMQADELVLAISPKWVENWAK